MNIGMSSRGDNEERVFAIANALHSEEHLSEIMEHNPRQAVEVAPILDEVRKNRQELVKLWSGGKGNTDVWCACKHKLSEELHLREMLNNASRGAPEDVEKISEILQSTASQRRELCGKFLSGEGKSHSCPRCEDDFKGSSLTKVLNRSSVYNNNDFEGEVIVSSIESEKGGRPKMIDWKELGLIAGGITVGSLLGIYVLPKVFSYLPASLSSGKMASIVGAGLGAGVFTLSTLYAKGMTQKLGMLAGGALVATEVLKFIPIRSASHRVAYAPAMPAIGYENVLQRID